MIHTHQPVFPFKHEWASGDETSTGIDLRTWMATQFMAAKMSHKGYYTNESAKHSVQAADALIAELNKTKPCPNNTP